MTYYLSSWRVSYERQLLCCALTIGTCFRDSTVLHPRYLCSTFAMVASYIRGCMKLYPRMYVDTSANVKQHSLTQPQQNILPRHSCGGSCQAKSIVLSHGHQRTMIQENGPKRVHHVPAHALYTIYTCDCLIFISNRVEVYRKDKLTMRWSQIRVEKRKHAHRSLPRCLFAIR